MKKRKTLRESTGSVRSATPKGLKLVLMKEGKSKNGIIWKGAVLESVARLAKGTPVQVLEFNKARFGKFFDHIRSFSRSLPSNVRSMLPDVFPKSIVGVISEATIVGTAPRRKVVGTMEFTESAGWFGKLIQQMAKLGSRLPGVSIVTKKPDFEASVDTVRGALTVTKLTGINHFDIVTNPSAGGAIQSVMESVIGESRMMFFELLCKMLPGRVKRLEKEIAESDRKKLTLTELAESHPTIADEYRKKLIESGAIDDPEDESDEEEEEEEEVDESDEDEDEDEEEEEEDEEDEEEDEKRESKARKKAKNSSKGQGKKKSQKKALKKKTELAESERQKAVDERLERVEVRECNRELDGILAESKLPKKFKKIVRRRFQDTVFESVELRREVKLLKKACAEAVDEDGLEGGAKVTNPMILESGLDAHDKIMDAAEALFIGESFHPESKTPAFMGVRDMYQRLSGDINCMGRPFFRRNRGNKKPYGCLAESVNWKDMDIIKDLADAKYGGNETMAIAEAMTTGGFTFLLADVMHQRMAPAYNEPDLQLWRNFATVDKVNDFRTWRVDRFGEYSAFPVVLEGGAYLPVTSPSEEEVTMQIAKYGGTENVTWEVIVNDRTRFVTQIPTKLAKASAWTLLSSFFTDITSSVVLYDSVALFQTITGATAHENQRVDALSYASLEAGIQSMKAHQDIDSVRPMTIKPRFLVVPTELFDLAVQLTTSAEDNRFVATGEPTADTTAVGNTGQRNTVLKYGIQVVEVAHMTDANDWILAADRGSLEYAIVAFLNGQETPSLFIQDLATVGSFFDNDSVTYKARHVWDHVISDYRGWYRGLVT